MFDQNTQADNAIGEVVNQIAAEPGVIAILLAGSRAKGTAWPGSDVDLLVIVEEGPSRQDTFEVGGLGFDIYRDTLQGLEARMAADGIACHAYLKLVPLVGGEEWKRRLEKIARRIYAGHMPGPEELQKMQEVVRSATRSLRTALGGTDRVAQAVAGGDLVWISARVCLGMVGIGPLREVEWHDALRKAALPFDAATPFARWHTGDGLEERLRAAITLAELALGESIEEVSLPAEPESPPPEWKRRPALSSAKIAEMRGQVLYGLGKFEKAVWSGDVVRQALEAAVIVWFAVPACLALTGIAPPPHRWWQAALRQAELPFDAAALHARALTGETLAERTTAAVELGRLTLDALDQASEVLK